MMNKSNFEFLKGVNDFTYAIACAAENNYPDDPNTALVKMRMFGEATAKHLGLLLDIPPCENQHELLRELGKIAFVDDSILSVFHKLRRIGNQAVHEYHNDLDDAQMCLREGANKQVISSQADSLIKISRIWADFFPANTSNQPI
ncbi:hypothetical protein BFV64_02395 [Enterobacter kobei]|nr:hypothetical protein BFV64_02395 [Enterobacter kobei]